MRRDVLPTLETVKAIVTGCGGTDQDLSAFTAAWHRICRTTPGSGFHAAPVPAM